jgi:hypothetical protein
LPAAKAAKKAAKNMARLLLICMEQVMFLWNLTLDTNQQAPLVCGPFIEIGVRS